MISGAAEPLRLTQLGDRPVKNQVLVVVPPATEAHNRRTVTAFAHHQRRNPRTQLFVAGDGGFDPREVAGVLAEAHRPGMGVHVASVGHLTTALSTMDGLRQRGLPLDTAIAVDAIDWAGHLVQLGWRRPARTLQLAVEGPVRDAELSIRRTQTLLHCLALLDRIPDGHSTMCDWSRLLRNEDAAADDTKRAMREHLADLAAVGTIIDLGRDLLPPEADAVVFDTAECTTAEDLLAAMRTASDLQGPLYDVANVLVPSTVDLRTGVALEPAERNRLVQAAVAAEGSSRGGRVYLRSGAGVERAATRLPPRHAGAHLIDTSGGTMLVRRPADGMVVVPRTVPQRASVLDDVSYLRGALSALGPSEVPPRWETAPQRLPADSRPDGTPAAPRRWPRRRR